MSDDNETPRGRYVCAPWCGSKRDPGQESTSCKSVHPDVFGTWSDGVCFGPSDRHCCSMLCVAGGPVNAPGQPASKTKFEQLEDEFANLTSGMRCVKMRVYFVAPSGDTVEFGITRQGCDDLDVGNDEPASERALTLLHRYIELDELENEGEIAVEADKLRRDTADFLDSQPYGSPLRDDAHLVQVVFDVLRHGDDKHQQWLRERVGDLLDVVDEHLGRGTT